MKLRCTLDGYPVGYDRSNIAGRRLREEYNAMKDGTKTVLRTGSTGYVGGRLLPLLEARGLNVRCLARRPDNLRGRVAECTEVVQGDVLDAASLHGALAGVDIAYYLVHSMASTGSFEEQDRLAAKNFGHAAREAGARIYVF